MNSGLINMSYIGCALYASFSAFLWAFTDEMPHLIARLGRWLVSVG